MLRQLTEMWLPIGLFCLFALISALGAYLITAHHRSRQAGVLVAVLVLLFFVGLAFGVLALMRESGMV
jgi:membrane protein implicated in regulation of membrane protease activity